MWCEQVQVYSSYPATAPQAVVTAIKESHNPARNVKAGKVPRPELPAQKVAAVQTQVQSCCQCFVTLPEREPK